MAGPSLLIGLRIPLERADWRMSKVLLVLPTNRPKAKQGECFGCYVRRTSNSASQYWRDRRANPQRMRPMPNAPSRRSGRLSA